MSLPYILHVSAIKTWGGGEQQLVYLYQELAKQQVPQLIVCQTDSALAKYCQQHQLHHITYSKIGSIDLKFVWKLRKLCKTYPIDIIHTHDAHSLTAALLVSTLFGIRSKLVTSRKVAFPIKKSWLSHYKYNAKSLKKIICISQAVYEVVAQTVQDKSKLTIISDGIDLERFKDLPTGNLRKTLQLSQDCYLVGIAASLVPSKDIFTFIAVAKQLLEQELNAKFLIMGDGPLKAQLQVYAKQLGIMQDIMFLGFRSDLPAILPELNVFMLTSTQEGMGSVLLEAMAADVPIVATRVGGIPELVVDGKTGLLAASGDVKGLSEATLQLLQNKTLARQLVQQAKLQLTEFSVENRVAKTLLLYQSL